MPKVLHLRASGQLLGAERVVLELAKNLPDHGYDTFIGIPTEKGEPHPEFALAAEQAGYNVVTFPISGAFDLSIAKHLKKYVKDNNIDIIHTHGYREDLYAILAKSKAKIVATNHLWKRTNLKLKLYAALDAFLLRFFDALIGVSQPVKVDMCKTGLKPENIEIISNGIDTTVYQHPVPKIESRESLQLPEDKLILGTLSSLTIEKGINFLIDAFSEARKQNPNLHLVIVGNGEEEESLREQTSKLELEQYISFAGRRSDINNILSALDIFVLPSLMEGLPMALLEAMAAGKAIIATDVGDVAQAVTPDTGELIESANHDALVHAILKLTNKPDLIKQAGEHAKQRAQAHFSASAMSRKYAEVYDNLLVKAELK